MARILVVILGLALAAGPPYNIIPDDSTAQRYRNQILECSASILEPWYHWDAGWMVNVAENGYAGAKDDHGTLGVAFMPAMPLCLAAALSLGISQYWFGMVVVNLVGAAGAASLARVAVKLTGNAGNGWRTLVLLLAFPSSFFCSAPYNESFGLLFTALALEAWLARRATSAGIFAFLGSLARMTGVAIGVAAIVGWLLDDRTRRGFKRALIVTIGSFAGLLLFWGYLWWVVGDPFAGVKVQYLWGRHPLSIWNPWRAIHSIYDPEWPHWGEGFLAFAFIVLGIRAWIKRGSFWGILILVPIAQMMASGTFLSGHRLILACVPAFIEMADLLRNRSLLRTTIAGFLIAQFILINRFVHNLGAG